MRARFALTSSAVAGMLLAGIAGCGSAGQPSPAAAPAPLAAPGPAAAAGPAPAAAAAGPAEAAGSAAGAQNCTEGPQGNVGQSLRPLVPLPPPGQMPAGSTMATIAERNRLVVGVDQDIYRFAYRDANLELQGFDIDVIHSISQAIFGNPDQVTYRPFDVADRIDSLNGADPVDLVVATLTVTCKRRDQAAFSSVYLETGQKVLVNRNSGIKGMADLHDKQVCAARGSTSLANILDDPAEPIGVGVPSTTDCLVLLQLREVDAVSTDATLLAGLNAQDPQTEIVGDYLSDEPYAIAISQTHPDLVRFVNAVLAQRVATGEWKRSYDKWLGPYLGESPAPPVPQYQD